MHSLFRGNKHPNKKKKKQQQKKQQQKDQKNEGQMDFSKMQMPILIPMGQQQNGGFNQAGHQPIGKLSWLQRVTTFLKVTFFFGKFGIL